MEKQTIHIKGMHCRSCELLLEEAFQSIDGVKEAKGDFKKSCVLLSSTKKISDEEIKKTVCSCGYEVGVNEPKQWFSKNSQDWQYVIFSLVVFFIIWNSFPISSFLNPDIDESKVNIPFALLLGLVAGISTCMAIVGGLVLGLSASHANKHPEATHIQKFRPHLFFNTGRIIGYAFLGGLLGIIGGKLQLSTNISNLLTFLITLVMIILGIKLTNLSPKIASYTFSLPSSLSKFLGIKKHEKEYSHKASFVLGSLTFFIPCGFTQAMQIYALSTGSFSQSALLLGAFAIGTSPSLLGIGLVSSWIKGTKTKLFTSLVGTLLLLFGFWNLQNQTVFSSPFFAKASKDKPTSSTYQTSPTSQTSDLQILKMRQTSSGYSPTTLKVKQGIPVKWIITSESSFTCASSLSVPSLNIQTNLKKGENIFEFTPNKKGTISFSCSMGMYRGQIIVE